MKRQKKFSRNFWFVLNISPSIIIIFDCEEMADGRWQMADGRWQMADGR